MTMALVVYRQCWDCVGEMYRVSVTLTKLGGIMKKDTWPLARNLRMSPQNAHASCCQHTC